MVQPDHRHLDPARHLDAPLDLTNGNRYAYAGDDPINNLDPAGTDCRLARQFDDGAIVVGGIVTFFSPAFGAAAPIVAGGAAGAIIGGGIGLFIVDSVY